MPTKYLFAVTLPVASLPLFVALAEVIFQLEEYILCVILEAVHVAELPLHVNVPFNVADHCATLSEL